MDFRLSRITEHNKNEETDHLYDPLRDTLRKSSVSRGKTLGRATSAQQLQGSRVSTRIRELSPEQAEKMQREIWIPADKKLKPTDHLTQVAGKEFYAVDVQERQGTALTQEQFKRIYNGDTVQKTVYEFGSSNDGSKQPSPFNFNQGLKARSNYNYGIDEPNRDTYVGFRETEVFRSRNNGYETGSQYGRVDSQKQSGLGRFSRGARIEASSNRDSRASGRRPEPTNKKFNEYDSNYNPQPNNNKQEGETRRSSKYGRAKSTYKYNLFSSLDEAVNTKCGSFGKNEVIATKPVRPWG